MKYISYLLFIISLSSLGQIKGNGTIVTKTFPFENVHTIKIDLYAKVTIDNSAKEGLEITTDANLFEYIDTEIVDGTIHFDQLEWIQPSKSIVIRIGAPKLTRVVHDTHDTTRIININNEILQINANIGKVIAEGMTKELRAGTEIGYIDASQLKADEVFVNIWDSGTIKVNPINNLWAEVTNDGKLLYSKLPEKNKIKTRSGGLAVSNSDYKMPQEDIKWIRFNIKNNSSNRHDFVVRGPKEDGSYFGYGFPMMPNSKRKENWSVGTKIYKQTTLGFKKLIRVITAEDEGTTVNLFD